MRKIAAMDLSNFPVLSCGAVLTKTARKLIHSLHAVKNFCDINSLKNKEIEPPIRYNKQVFVYSEVL